MGLLDILAKLGIFRYGAKKATWKSSKEMPEEFLLSDVLNAERDLTTRQDVKNIKDRLTGKTASDPDS